MTIEKHENSYESLALLITNNDLLFTTQKSDRRIRPK